MLIQVVPLFRRNVLNQFKGISRRYFSLSTRIFKQDADDDRPIKFSSSPAYKYKASTTRKGYTEPRLWYEQYVIIASISIFMIYFTILREENDIDHDLTRSLYSRIEGLEEFQLRQALEYNKSHGIDTSNITKRLEELEAEKQMRQQNEDQDE